MIVSDFHTHTTLSTDGRSDMKDMIDAAADKGLKYICFTEHYDYDNVFDEGEDAFVTDVDKYLKVYDSLKSHAKSRNINIYFGLELGLQTYLADDYHLLANKYPFDFLIGSSHLARRMDVAFPAYFNSFGSLKAAMTAYFDAEVACAMCHSDFDIYGHLDYAWRYAPEKPEKFEYADYAESLDRLLAVLIKKDKGIEINTAGFRKNMNGPNPDISILEKYHELGGELITVGSDAHSVDEVAADFDLAEKILKDVGFKKYAVFEQRKPLFIDL